MPRKPYGPSVVLTPRHLEEVVEHYRRFDEFVFDVETRGERPLDPERNEVYWLSLAGPGCSHSIPFGHPNGELDTPKHTATERYLDYKHLRKDGLPRKKQRKRVVPATFYPPPSQMFPDEVFSILEPLFFSDKRKIGHNVKFDLRSIAKYYKAIPDPPYGDTLVTVQIVNENIPTKTLDALTQRIFKFKYQQLGKNLQEEAFSDAAQYARLDSKYDWLLWQRCLDRIDELGLWDPFELDHSMLEAAVRAEHYGVMVDEEQLHSADRVMTKDLERIKKDLFKAAGAPWNPNSDRDKAWFIYDVRKHKVTKMTKGGKNSPPQPSVAEPVIKKYVDKDPHIAKLLEFAGKEKLHGTYIEGFSKRELSGRIHTNFRVHGTVTGRLSSSEPNLQNIPRPGDEYSTLIRGLFIAGPGKKLLVADYDQIELRLIAHFSRDPALCNIFDNNIDPHAGTAAEIYNKPLEEITPDLRNIGKTLNFAISYGAGAPKVAASAGVTLEKAESLLNDHKKQFRGVHRWIKHTVREARRQNPPEITMLLGRKRRLPDLMSGNKYERESGERKAINSLIQGSAAEIFKLATVRFEESRKDSMRPVLFVHDETVVEVPEDEVEKASGLLQEAMVGEEMQKLVTVPLLAEPTVVDRWSEAKG